MRPGGSPGVPGNAKQEKRDMMRQIHLYDTTLRDGAQSDGVDFSVHDKISISHRLDQLGMDYIEGGWPGANNTDTAYFEAMRSRPLLHARLAAFGSTCRANIPAEQDAVMRSLAACCAPVATIFGKTCPLHVSIALGISPDDNLRIIRDSVGFLSSCKEETIYDAEHFFDGYKRDPDYALATLQAAWGSGAASLVLCDTNGGSLPEEISEIVQDVAARFPDAPLGIHAHNDCGLAVANSLAAIDSGASMIQGTMNGIGERCGNADLCTIIPNVLLKKKGACRASVTPRQLATLHDAARAICDIANLTPSKRAPFVGDAAFAHKGGVHVSAINKNPALYEHIPPESVGSSRRILISAQGGKSNIQALANRLGIQLPSDSTVLRELSEIIKDKAAQGYDYAAAEASAELLLRKHLGELPVFFRVKRLYVIDCKTEKDDDMTIEASVKLAIDGKDAHTAASGIGPVDALERALRRALLPFYPELDQLSLIDYKVRVLTAEGRNSRSVGPGAVRVLIDAATPSATWTTVGVSHDLIKASWQALTDAIEYFLMKGKSS